MPEPKRLPIPDELLAPLTKKQRAFLLAYLEQDCKRPGDAYRQAYSNNGSVEAQNANARKLLRHPLIAPILKLINTRLSKKAHSIALAAPVELERLALSQERVLEEIGRIGMSDPRGVVRWGTRVVAAAAPEDDPTGTDETREVFVEPKDSDELTDAQAAAISEISMGPKGIRIKFHDKPRALQMLGQHLGLFPREARNVNVNISLGLMVEQSFKIETEGGGD